MKTSGQAYEEYQKLRVVEDKLMRENKGLNLINSQESKPTFSIHLYKEVEGNLLTMTSSICVNSNLPFMSWNFQNVSVNEFFKKFVEFVELPVFKRFIKLNRRQENQLSSYGQPKFRENIIDIKDIDISFGDECLKEMDKDFASNIKQQISDILDEQRIANEQETKDFTRYFFLSERIDDLKRQGKESSYGGYNYGRSPSKETLKIIMPDEEYNEKLKLVEDELKSLNKTYEFLELPRFDYKEDEEEDCDEDEDYEE